MPFVFDLEELFPACISLCERLAHRLHQEGIIIERFGRPIPVIIADAEGVVEVESLVQANPESAEGLAECFEYHKDTNGT